MGKKTICLIACITLLVLLLAEVVPVPENIIPEKIQGPNKYYNIKYIKEIYEKYYTLSFVYIHELF